MKKTHPAKSIQVLVADDHSFLASGVVGELKKEGIECVAVLISVANLISEYERSRPDVLVLDVSYGDEVTGFSALSDLLQRYPDARAVFLSQHDDDEVISEAYRVGGLSFIPKRKSSRLVLAEAIRQVHAGNTHLLPEIADQLARLSLQGLASPRAILTQRELKVFEMMARGHTNEEMAKVLGVTPRMVSINSQSVKTKLKVERSAEITLLAVKYKIIEP
ncbi:MAG: response regulator transcription factor [Burkholderiales bacterium]|jgi:two-component system, NarL family, invasion response regulator UvrY|nr:response regulator transcription factor [Burkholderiales bacterium]